MSPAIEAVAMTWPPPASIMSGRKVSAVQTTPFRLTSVIQSSSLSVSSVTGMNEVAPALANTSWMVPSAALASAFICSIDERSQTSQWIATAVPPASLISSATLRALSGRMSAIGDGRALAGQLLGQAHADAAAAAGDHGRLAGDLGHAVPPESRLTGAFR